MKNWIKAEYKKPTLWLGEYLSVRSTTWRRAKDYKLNLIIEWVPAGKYVYVPYARLDEGKHNQLDVINSHFNDQPYYMIDYSVKNFGLLENAVQELLL